MKRRLSALMALLALAVAPALTYAQAAPLPDPKPPTLEVIDDSVEPTVTIRKQDGDTFEEYRVNGRLYKVKVTPAHGAPYVLIDRKGDGNFSAVVDGPGSPALSVPMWVIGTF